MSSQTLKNQAPNTSMQTMALSPHFGVWLLLSWRTKKAESRTTSVIVLPVGNDGKQCEYVDRMMFLPAYESFECF